MTEPNDALRQLAAQGRQLRAQYLAAIETMRLAPVKMNVGVDLADFFFDLSGYKRTATRVGKLLAMGSAATARADLQARYESWSELVRSTLRDVTEVGRGAPRKPNGALLLARFSKTQRFTRFDTRLAHGVAYLEALADGRVVRNEDLQALRATAGRRRPQRAAPASILAEAEEVAGLLVGLPSEVEAVRGAVEVYRARMPDFGRQALSSLRNALENLVKRLSGEGDFSAGLEKLLPSDTRRRTIRQVHSFLSAYGPHGPNMPTEADVEMGFRLGIAAIRSLLTGRPP